MSDNFVFNSKHSLDDMGLYTEIITRPLFAEPKTIYEDIPGTDGEVSFTSSNPKGRMCFKPRIIELECHFAGDDESTAGYIRRASELAAWLATDENKILTFDDEDGIQYLAHAANLFNIERITDFSGTFPLVFKCDPFRYNTSVGMFMDTSTVCITNKGYYTPAKITVSGTAPYGFSLFNSSDSKKLTVNAPLDGTVAVIDTGAMTAAINGISVLHQCVGEFFEIAPGESIVNFEGTNSDVTVVVEFAERYL